MILLGMIIVAGVLGAVVYRAQSFKRSWRAAMSIAVVVTVALLAYVVDAQREALDDDRRWARLHCEFFADGRLKAVADDAVGLPVERFDPSRSLSADRLNDYLREIAFCTHDGRDGKKSPCAEGLREQLHAAANESSPAAFAERLRNVAAAIKSGPGCD